MSTGSNPASPRTPTLNDAERINRALGKRIIHQHEQYQDLKLQFAEMESKHVELEKELRDSRSQVESLKARLQQAEDESARLRAEVEVLAASKEAKNGASNGTINEPSNGVDKRITRKR